MAPYGDLSSATPKHYCSAGNLEGQNQLEAPSRRLGYKNSYD